MFFRRQIIAYSDTKPEGEESEILFLVEKIDHEIELAIKKALLFFDNQQSLVNRTLSYIFKESPPITLLRKHARHKRISLDEFCELLSMLGKIQSNDPSISKTIMILKDEIEKAIQWDIFKLIAALEKFKQNNTAVLIQVIKSQEYVNELHIAHAIIKKDLLDATLYQQKNGDEFFIERYWESDIHWQKMFDNIQCAGLITQSISLISKLPGMTTAINCHKIYDSHHLANLLLLAEFEKSLENIYLNFIKTKETLGEKMQTSATTRLSQYMFVKEQVETAFAPLKPVIKSYDHYQRLPALVSSPSPLFADTNYLGNSVASILPSAPPAFLSYEEEDKVTKPTYLTKVGSFKVLPKENTITPEKKKVLQVSNLAYVY